MKRTRHGFLHDEQGDRSYARLGLTLTLAFTALVIVAAIGGAKVPEPVWSLLGGTIIGFMAWAGGRAAMRYLGPQVAGVAQAVGSAARGAYTPDETLPRRIPPDPE